VSDRSGWRGRGSRHERGYGAAWVRLRKHILERDKHICQPCLAAGMLTTHKRGASLEVDHITPKAKGGTDDPENLQAICRPCHRDKTQREAAEAQGRAARPRMAFDEDGWPVWPEGR